MEENQLVTCLMHLYWGIEMHHFLTCPGPCEFNRYLHFIDEFQRGDLLTTLTQTMGASVRI